MDSETERWWGECIKGQVDRQMDRQMNSFSNVFHNHNPELDHTQVLWYNISLSVVSIVIFN